MIFSCIAQTNIYFTYIGIVSIIFSLYIGNNERSSTFEVIQVHCAAITSKLSYRLAVDRRSCPTCVNTLPSLTTKAAILTLPSTYYVQLCFSLEHFSLLLIHHPIPYPTLIPTLLAIPLLLLPCFYSARTLLRGKQQQTTKWSTDSRQSTACTAC